jgi:hypothetical protein
MTLSRDDRVADMKRALGLLLEAVGAKPIAGLYFSVDQLPLSEINRTTWIELRQKGYLAPLFSNASGAYALTGAGYLKALTVAGITEQDGFKSNLGLLAATLKRHVKGRHEPAFVSVESVQQECGLSQGFIFNAVESNALEVCFNKRGAHWAKGFSGKLIAVQTTFGHEPIDF